MKITRAWAMPSKDTFSIKPIYSLIKDWWPDGGTVVDMFAGESPFKGLCISNDVDASIQANHHMDAEEFMAGLGDGSADMVLFDPPYSPRQLSECYKKMGKSVTSSDTTSAFWSRMKEQISRVVRDGGIVISCGWNSGGIGKKYGFHIEEILLVPHGGQHNDTIVVVERRIPR